MSRSIEIDASSASLRLGKIGPRMGRLGLGLGVVGVLLSLLLLWLTEGVDAGGFFRSYLTAFLFILSISLGGLFFTIVQHLTRTGWGVNVRRLAEGFASNLQWIWILFLPILFLVLSGRGGELYSWMDPAHSDEILAGKAPYLNVPFWVGRAIFFLAAWAALARFFVGNSIRQDESGAVALTHRMQQFAPIGMIVFALTQTFAIFDWGMSLEAHWFSTMYGVYFFAASCCGIFAALLITMYFLQRSGRVENEITLEHYQDVGKLLFGFGVVFWAYIAFSQYMLIWYANIPEETNWYLARILGGWTGVSWLLLIGHFVIPFLLLVTKHTKRIKPVIALIAGWLLLMHYVDLYWLVMPHVPGAKLAEAESLEALRAVATSADLGFHPGLVDLTCLAGMVGLLIAGTARGLKSCALIPVHDPRLPESLAFENM